MSKETLIINREKMKTENYYKRVLTKRHNIRHRIVQEINNQIK